MTTMTKTLFSALVYFSLIAPASAAIYVENLAASVTEQELEILFSQHGKVMKIELETSDNTESKVGFVHMGNFSMEKEAIDSLHGTEIGGEKINVSRAKPRLQEYGVLLP